MPESFGARLRQKREEQQIALGSIAEQTKIKLSLLEELERDDVSHWPTGIFRRAFVRTYAHAIGLDPDVVVREFLQLYPDPTEVIALETPIAAGADGATGGPPMRFSYLIGSALGALGLKTSNAPRAEQAPPLHASGVQVSAELARRNGGAELARPNGVGAELARPKVEQAPPPHGGVVGADLGRPDAVGAELARPRTEQLLSPVRPPASDPDLLAVADLCTELGRVDSATELAPLLHEAARILDAVGLIIWVWDPMIAELRAALAHGYSDKVLAQLPTVRRDAHNATAAAFRSVQTCAIDAVNGSPGALAVPMITPIGCMGVLAIELHQNSEQTGAVRALATIFAAQLAGWIDCASEVEIAARRRA
jgi:Helix-turn-helix domain/GAF domain